MMTASLSIVSYLGATILFILCLGGLSNPETSRRGNVYGIIGMAIAVVVTLALVYANTKNVAMILIGIAAGGAVGAVIARRVQMTQMPELVAAMHSLVGLAAVLIAFAVVNDPSAFTLDVPIPRGNRLELPWLSGAVVALGKRVGVPTPLNRAVADILALYVDGAPG